METEKVKRELRELRYYYSRKEQMDALFRETGETRIPAIVRKYNNAIRLAPVQLYDLYGCLYIRNQTQEAAAIELNYSIEYVRRLNKALLQFFARQNG